MKDMFQSSFRALPALAGLLMFGTLAATAAQPRLQALLPGKWPAWPRGSAYDVKVVGNYAYVALGEYGLAVFDVSTPTNCVQVGGCDTRGSAERVAVAGNYAYVADGGLQVIDVSNPANPVRVGGCTNAPDGHAYGMAVAGNYAYVAGGMNGLAVIDVTDPANPARVGSYDTSTLTR
jgi:hypothetical protein